VGKVEIAMSTEALNRIMKEVNALTAQERLDLIDRLANRTDEGEITTDKATLREWLNEARNMRAELPLTSDSVDILRELREVRSRQ
jgi:hypothetical protein